MKSSVVACISISAAMRSIAACCAAILKNWFTYRMPGGMHFGNLIPFVIADVNMATISSLPLPGEITDSNTEGSASTTEYSCAECNESFDSLVKWDMHSRMHPSAGPHPCPACGKLYKERGSLTKHIPVHSGERPFRCDRCPKAFTSKSSLLLHTRTHSGEKPYRCRLCTSEFSQSCNRDKHERLSHQNSRYIDRSLAHRPHVMFVKQFRDFFPHEKDAADTLVFAHPDGDERARVERMCPSPSKDAGLAQVAAGNLAGNLAAALTLPRLDEIHDGCVAVPVHFPMLPLVDSNFQLSSHDFE